MIGGTKFTRWLVISLILYLTFGVVNQILNILEVSNMSRQRLAPAIQQRLATIESHKTFDVIVVSAGGVGTTSVISEFGACLSTNNEKDYDGLKHSRFPITHIPTKRAIFVYGDPIQATMSLFRRGFAGFQSFILTGGRCRIKDSWDLDTYAKVNRDLLQYNWQFYQWVFSERDYPVMFLNYSSLGNRKSHKTITTFLGIDESCFEFEFKSRNPHTDDIEPNTLQVLHDMYDPFLEELEKLPDEFVLGSNKVSLWSPLWQEPYMEKNDRITMNMKNQLDGSQLTFVLNPFPLIYCWDLIFSLQ